MHLQNSDIRRIILNEHGELKKRFEALTVLLGRFERGEHAMSEDLQARLKFLCEYFLRHITHEEKILEPVLAKLDAWGQVRTQKMDDEHKQQRAQIDWLLKLNPTTEPVKYAQGVHAFIDTVLEDMADEEANCLSEKVLRDDIIAIDGASS